MLKLSNVRLAVVCFGCVALPLAAKFSKKHPVVCCDINPERINACEKAHSVSTTKKVTAGATGEVAESVGALYRFPGQLFRPRPLRWLGLILKSSGTKVGGASRRSEE